MNCTRWVSSCRQTQSRKSVRVGADLALDVHDVRARPAAAGRPGRRTGRTGRAPCRRGSRAAPPTSAPVTREPTALGEPGGRRPSLAGACRRSGPSRVAKPSALACTQPARSTTSTGAVRSPASRPVKSRTSAGGAVGARRAARRPRRRPRRARPRALPGEPGAERDREVPVDHAATVDAGAERGAGVVRRGLGCAAACSGSTVRRPGQRRPAGVSRRSGRRQGRAASSRASRASGCPQPDPVGDQRRSQRVAVEVGGDAGQAVTPVRVPVLARTRPRPCRVRRRRSGRPASR